MREEGDPAARGPDTHASADQLSNEPHAQDDARWDTGHSDYRQQHQDVRTWKEKEVGTEHCRNGSAGSDHRDLGGRVRQRMAQRGENPGHEVKNDKFRMTHDVFDVVPENPQVQHVA